MELPPDLGDLADPCAAQMVVAGTIAVHLYVALARLRIVCIAHLVGVAARVGIGRLLGPPYALAERGRCCSRSG